MRNGIQMMFEVTNSVPHNLLLTLLSIQRQRPFGLNALMRPRTYAPSEWDVKDVTIWLRRLRYKKHVAMFQRFGIDGKLLLALDWEDFVALGTQHVHVGLVGAWKRKVSIPHFSTGMHVIVCMAV